MNSDIEKYDNLFNTAFLGGVQQITVDPCFKCKHRNDCNEVEHFIKFEQSVAKQVNNLKIFYDVDVVRIVNEMVEKQKDKLVCKSFEDDETVNEKWSAFGLVKLQNK